MRAMRLRAWSPYLVGIGLGLLSWFTFASANKALGVTTSFEYTAAMTADAVDAAPVQPYLSAKAREDKRPKIDWQWLLVLGIFLGAWLSSRWSGDREPHGEPVPVLWRRRFGDAPWPRYLAAFVGGAVMMLGARLADGCTSGHGISGGLQLAVSSWLFVVVFFTAGILTALALYGRPDPSLWTQPNREVAHV